MRRIELLMAGLVAALCLGVHSTAFVTASVAPNRRPALGVRPRLPPAQFQRGQNEPVQVLTKKAPIEPPTTSEAITEALSVVVDDEALPAEDATPLTVVSCQPWR
jgi:hypothetical protein